ncbi:hypothetical protein [Streptomyces sp. NPDC001880]
MPTGRAAATEQGLRAAQHPTGFDLLSNALRSLALNIAAADRELPVIEAVVLHDAKVELHLAEDTTPMKPFTATAGRKDLWTCPASSQDLADEEQLKNADAPYPALISIGWDHAGHLVLIDLEHVGILNLAGDTDFARQVLQAIAVELASTPLPGHLEVTALADTAPGLDTAAPERVVRTDNLADATTELTSHTADQRRALSAIGADNLRAARLMDDAAGAWTPHILLADTLPGSDDTHVTALFDALTEEPRTAGAVITADASATLPATAWTLECQGPDHTLALPGSDLAIKLQGLSDEHFADAIELLTLAASNTDVEAPEWTRADDQEASEEPAPADETDHAEVPESTTDENDADDDGLPAEYAELEQEAAEDGPQEEPTGPSLADVLNATDEPPAAAVQPEPRTEPLAEASPAVLLLGPISIEGASGRIDSSRRSAGIELTAFLALNPGVDHHAIDDALWPGRLVNKQMRNAVISRTRSWLGKDTDGKAHLPRVQDTGDSRYRLGTSVTCDWTRFQRLARTGLARHDEDGDLALRRALALVRGRPFTGIDPQRYAWAEPVIQEMVSAIVDVAYELSTRCREANDIPGALWAAHRGLLAAEESEMLHRQIFLAHHTAGDITALREAAARLAHINDQLLGGVDMEAETAELLRNLLPRPITRAR